VTEIPPDPPPAELASDPERLAMWQSRNGGYAFDRLVGCGQSKVYRCHTMGKCGLARVERP
jgi:hypothetical protein